ncbi:MAG: hypothetical protein OXH90_03500 [Paracoccaceae bacterium]|nr:hypothetical protein [Paracoccaceae bacterium]MDE2916895.1 hypothetical protein [Paracoccaceae bacterium]
MLFLLALLVRQLETVPGPDLLALLHGVEFPDFPPAFREPRCLSARSEKRIILGRSQPFLGSGVDWYQGDDDVLGKISWWTGQHR